MDKHIRDSVLGKLKHVDTQLLHMTMNHEMWREMNESLHLRPTNVDGYFWHFFTQNYIHSMFVGLRAAADKRGGRSLYSAIDPIATGKLEVTLEDWLAMPGGPESGEALARWRLRQTRAFYHIAGERASLYPKERAARHQKHLLQVVSRIKNVVDKEIAHWDNAAAIKRPVLGTLQRALDQCGRVHDEYYFLLTGVHAGSRAGVLDSSWKEGLLHDWFPGERARLSRVRRQR